MKSVTNASMSRDRSIMLSFGSHTLHRCKQEPRMATRSKLTKAQLETLRRKLEDERSRVNRVLQTPADTPSGDERSGIEETAQRATERTKPIRVAQRERTPPAQIQ